MAAGTGRYAQAHISSVIKQHQGAAVLSSISTYHVVRSRGTAQPAPKPGATQRQDFRGAAGNEREEFTVADAAVQLNPGAAGRDRLGIPGMGARPPVRAQEGSLVTDHRWGVQSGRGTAHWKAELAQRDFCKPAESTAPGFEMPSPSLQEWQGGRTYCRWHFQRNIIYLSL